MNDLAALSDTTTMLVIGSLKLALTIYMAASMLIINKSVRGSRIRYHAASLLRTATIPATVLITAEAAVSAAAGDWMNAILNLLLLVLMPVYFRIARDDDNWWTGRGTKIRKALKAAFSKPAASTNTAGA